MFLKIEFPDPTTFPSFDLFDVPMGVVHCNIVSELDEEAFERQRKWHESNGYDVYGRSMWQNPEVSKQITIVEITIPGPQPKVVLTNYHATLVRDGGVPMEALFRYRPVIGSSPVTNEATAASVPEKASRKRRATKKTTKRRTKR